MLLPKKIAVLTFPGNNCEQETKRSLINAGFESDIFLWNQNPEDLLSYDGVVIPGGFSFEDRGRSGIISVQENVFATLRKMGQAGKPILGICNGAQMLVESGLILEDSTNNIPSLALLRNKRKNEDGQILGTGFYHRMIYMKPVNSKTPFTNFAETLHVPIAHGEGRFTAPKEIEKEIISKNLIVFRYTDEHGKADEHYPVNPNGSFQNAAAICNPAGNIVAMMPHPERIDGGDGVKVFESLHQYFQNPWELNNESPSEFIFPFREIQKTPKSDVSFIIRLKITDKAEKTFENVIQKQFDNSDIQLIRREQWDINFDSDTTLDTDQIIEQCKKIVLSNELINTNKQWCVIKINNEYYDWNDGNFELSTPRFETKNMFLVKEKEDFRGQSKTQHFRHEMPDIGIENISFFVSWESINTDVEKLSSLSLFASYTGEDVFGLIG